ncbi:MAG TPA: ABC transporter ATP-binding protein [Caldithrix abyssi]|uniref:ABC transporter ATP-binding protein n=1 Tax=Caldithrix abyssi TaxID=187145 RepID=A0A7V4UCP4_CALAY|nr:ABC transporter ATP-binding protein [Caldithrix abyssi]
MDSVVECKNLTHYYGKKLVYENMSFNIRQGRVFGLLGKNGTGKTTTINILNGYLRPASGQCLIFGEDSQHITPDTKRRIGFLMEGHIQYSFMNIHQIEKFYSVFYPRWKKEIYYELMDKLEVEPNQKISTMSCGQRSQVALGLILAQDPDLMILDDYSMGLDAGYRRLFLDYLSEYVRAENKTIFITSHIIQDLEDFVEDIVILDYKGVLLKSTVEEFKKTFKQYRFTVDNPKNLHLEKDEVISNVEIIKNHVTLYSFRDQSEVQNYLQMKKIDFHDFKPVPMSLEDAFIGLTGKY